MIITDCAGSYYHPLAELLLRSCVCVFLDETVRVHVKLPKEWCVLNATGERTVPHRTEPQTMDGAGRETVTNAAPVTAL